MDWIVFGFLTAIFLECMIRVLSSHERKPERESKETKISMPMSQWGLLGLLTWGLLRHSQKENQKQ